MNENEFTANGRYDYRAGESMAANPYPFGTAAHTDWDRGYWAEHDESFEDNGAGIEDSYGDYYDYDAVSQGFYDDDPSPYDGTYSEM